MKIKKILAPTDLSKTSMAGVRAAIEMAKESDAEVTVYHVLCLDEFVRFELTRARPLMLEKLTEKCRAELDALLSCELPELRPFSRVKTAVEVGVPDKNIVDKATRDEVDMIVMSTNGRTGVAHVFSGSVTESVVRRAPCAVLSIRPESPAAAVVAAA
ncbi:MAG TPA: universal stress protein [Candidatus Binatia bacterium]|jgi:nucleotide-binding universal stress UspA family protein